MSVSIYWRPVVNNKRYVGKSQLKDVLETAFNQLPIKLNESDIPVLRGIHASGIEGAEALIRGIEEHEVIEVTAEY